jgi:phosphoadenosine phosphosulfate reductase
MEDKIKSYNRELKNSPPEDILSFFAKKFAGAISFATSLGAEDQVITKMISEIDPAVRIITLDTGRLFQETYDLIDITTKKYGMVIHASFPDGEDVEEMVNTRGINLFYDSVENRKLCCHIRKVEPLKRALRGMDAWISGLRREQSVTRKHLEIVEWDETNQKIKISPLLGWTEAMVWDYIKANKVPYNTLHDKGYPSIGCLPCTRAVQPGEDIRAGRWWWENPDNKECGLHVKE